MISIKNKEEIKLMSEACRIVKDTLFLLEKSVKDNLDFVFSSRYEGAGSGSDDDTIITSLT